MFTNPIARRKFGGLRVLGQNESLMDYMEWMKERIWEEIRRLRPFTDEDTITRIRILASYSTQLDFQMVEALRDDMLRLVAELLPRFPELFTESTEEAVAQEDIFGPTYFVERPHEGWLPEEPPPGSVLEYMINFPSGEFIPPVSVEEPPITTQEDEVTVIDPNGILYDLPSFHFITEPMPGLILGRPQFDYYDPVLGRVIMASGGSFVAKPITPSTFIEPGIPSTALPTAIAPSEAIGVRLVEYPNIPLTALPITPTIEPTGLSALTAGFDLGSKWPILAIVGIGALMMFKKGPKGRTKGKRRKSRRR